MVVIVAIVIVVIAVTLVLIRGKIYMSVVGNSEFDVHEVLVVELLVVPWQWLSYTLIVVAIIVCHGANL